MGIYQGGYAMLLTQLIGLIGIGLLIVTFQVNSRRKMLFFQILTCLVWTIYYVLTGVYTGAGLVFLGAIRSYVFEKYKRHTWIYELAIVVFAAATFVTWKDWTSILALVGMIIATTAMWQENPRYIRTISLFVMPFWLSYNYLNGSYLGMAGDLITFSSVVVGIYRFDITPLLRARSREKQVSDAARVSLV